MIWKTLPAEEYLQLVNKIPLRRYATLEEIAGFASLPVSDSASHVAGNAVDVNGGIFFS